MKHNPRTEIRSSLKPFFVGVALTGPLLCLANPASAMTVTFTENGGGAGVISVSFSGSFNFSSGVDSSFLFTSYINPDGGTVSFANSVDLSREWFTDPNPHTTNPTMVVTSTSSTPAVGAVFAGYGTGGFVNGVLSNVTGAKFATYLNGFELDRSIASGQAISGSATLSGTFASRGISAGTFTTNFTLDGQPNTLTYQVNNASSSQASVPGPLPILGVAAAFGFSRKLRKRIKLHKGTSAVSTSPGA